MYNMKNYIHPKKAKFGSDNPFYGHKHTDEWKALRSLQSSGVNHHQYGIPKSKETRQKISQTLLLNHPSRGKCQSPEHREKRLAKIRGRVLSIEIREKISIAHKHSLKCKRVFFKKGDLNPRWQNGISQITYDYRFSKLLKDKIRQRDNYRCRLCFTYENGKRHLCHHIDYDKHNTTENNLVLLCRICNNLVNDNREYWMQYFTKLLHNNQNYEFPTTGEQLLNEQYKSKPLKVKNSS